MQCTYSNICKHIISFPFGVWSQTHFFTIFHNLLLEKLHSCEKNFPQNMHWLISHSFLVPRFVYPPQGRDPSNPVICLQIVSKREEALDLSGAFNGRGRKAALQGGSLLHYSILNGVIKMIQVRQCNNTIWYAINKMNLMSQLRKTLLASPIVHARTNWHCPQSDQ